METRIKKLAYNIGQTKGFDDEQIKVVAYGLTAIVQMFTIFIIISFFGLITGCFIEAVISFVSVGLFRRTVGGAHSKSYNGCLIMSSFMIFFISILTGKPIFNSKVYSFIFVSLCYLIIYLIVFIKAPVDNPNKRIKTKEKRKRLRIEAFITISIYFIISLLLILFKEYNIKFINYAFALVVSVLWQSFVLTKPGFMFINCVDKLFNKIN